MYVETDFLIALLKDDDWLRDPAVRALEERDDIHTSILAYAEVLVLFYDREAAEYDIDAPRAVTDLLELVPVRPNEHEDAVLAAAAFLDEYDLPRSMRSTRASSRPAKGASSLPNRTTTLSASTAHR